MSSGVDYPLEETIQFLFTTRSFSTGAPTQLAGTPVVSVYEDDNLTQITAGVTLSVDHDSVTGLNRVAVVATAANGYESGKSYHLVITTGTVGGVSVVGEVVGHFTINRAAALRPTTAGRTLDVAATGEAGVDLDNTSGTLAAAQIATDAITADKIAADAIGSSELATTAVNEIRDAILSDSTAFAGANVDAAISSRATPAQVNTEVDTALADVNLDHLVGTATGIPAMPAGVFLDQIMRQAAGAFDRETDSLQAIRDTAPLGTAMRGTDSAATAADVNAQVLDVLNTDTFAEPGQGAPPATTTLVNKIGYLYKFLRNRITVTASTISVYNDDATTVDQKSTHSDDATTYDRGEFTTGP